jgi:hypothetical protein
MQNKVVGQLESGFANLSGSKCATHSTEQRRKGVTSLTARLTKPQPEANHASTQRLPFAILLMNSWNKARHP